MIRALLFDAAGTLIEPAEPVADVYARAASSAGRVVDAALVKSAFGAAFAGAGDPDWSAYPDGDAAERGWWREVVERTFSAASGGPLDEDFGSACFEALFSYYAKPEAWRVFPEVEEVMVAARAAGLRLAVVSNFDRRLHGILAGHGLEFEAVVTSADTRSRKPDSGIFQHSLQLLQLSAGEVLHAGDSVEADAEGAGRMGIQAFLVERPDRSLRDFLEVALENRAK